MRGRLTFLSVIHVSASLSGRVAASFILEQRVFVAVGQCGCGAVRQRVATAFTRSADYESSRAFYPFRVPRLLTPFRIFGPGER